MTENRTTTRPNRDMNRDMNRDIQECLSFPERDGKRDISGAGISDTPPMSRLPLSDVPDVPVKMSRMSRPERRAVFQGWVEAGRPWPPPAGLASACLGALLRKNGNARRW